MYMGYMNAVLVCSVWHCHPRKVCILNSFTLSTNCRTDGPGPCAPSPYIHPISKDPRHMYNLSAQGSRAVNHAQDLIIFTSKHHEPASRLPIGTHSVQQSRWGGGGKTHLISVKKLHGRPFQCYRAANLQSHPPPVHTALHFPKVVFAAPHSTNLDRPSPRQASPHFYGPTLPLPSTHIWPGVEGYFLAVQSVHTTLGWGAHQYRSLVSTSALTRTVFKGSGSQAWKAPQEEACQCAPPDPTLALQ
jgi:hypothetical protein